MKKIFIDPGHGGLDPGALGNGLKEKDLNLRIALHLKDILANEYRGHEIKLSRTLDETKSLKERTKMANQWGADLLISIHINAGGGTGFESYIYQGNYPSKIKTSRIRDVLHKQIIAHGMFQNRGQKTANFHMLRESLMSAILTENGFIDNHVDARQLKQDAFLVNIAKGHAVGIAEALELQDKHQSNVITHMIKKGDTLWRIAQSHQTTVNQLQKLNPEVDPKRLQIGKEIRLH